MDQRPKWKRSGMKSQKLPDMPNAQATEGKIHKVNDITIKTCTSEGATERWFHSREWKITRYLLKG
jgi:hypothetical protein